MAGLGWTGTSPYGLQETLRQQVKDQIEQQQQGFSNNILAREMALREQTAQGQEADRQAALAQRATAENDAAAGKIGSSLSIGDSIPDPTAMRLRGSFMAGAVQDNPPLAQPPASALGGDAMAQPDIQPGGQPGAVWKGTDAQRTNARQEQQDNALISDPNTAEGMKLFLRGRPIGDHSNIPYQLITEPNGPPGKLVPVNQNGTGVYMNEKDAVGKPVFEKPDKPQRDPPNHYQLKPELDPITGKETGNYYGYNEGTNSWELTKGAGPKGIKAAPGAATNDRIETMSRYASGDIDAAMNEVAGAEQAGMLGPVNGRAVGQFLGGVVGSTGDPAKDAQLGRLRGAISTLKQSYPGAITGSQRGGGAQDRLKTVLDTNNFSADALRGALDEMKSAVQRRTGDGAAPTLPTTGSGAAPQAPAGWKYVPKPGGGWTAVEAK